MAFTQRIRTILFSALFSTGTLLAFGQTTAIQGNGRVPTLTLAQAVETALLHNLNVKSYEVSLKNAELSYQQAKFNQLPSVNGNINQAASFGRSINPYTNGYDSRNINYNNVGLNASVLLFNGGQLKNNIAQTDFSLKASREDLL
ncbi:MAG: hypothetical protein RL246_1351, partial [Bacteroidota bacterium]